MSGWKKRLCCIAFACITCTMLHGQTTWYNTDSLLDALSTNNKIAGILAQAITIYEHAGIDTGNISMQAFKVAYLEKTLIDRKKIHIKHGHRYRNKQFLTVIDFTKKGNTRRFAIIDLRRQVLLYDTLVSQGSGKEGRKNDKYHVPEYFSNTVNSELSSLGLMGSKKARQTENPCHLCRYALTDKHKDVVVLEGLEKDINDNIKRRDIIVHTTGSKDLGRVLVQHSLHINDDNYRVAENECKCYHSLEDGKAVGFAAYASACGLAENNGYIGQSNGCLVLPEEDHIAIMNTIKKRQLIFTYSNVINGEINYFAQSPIIRKILRYSSKG